MPVLAHLLLIYDYTIVVINAALPAGYGRKFRQYFAENLPELAQFHRFARAQALDRRHLVSAPRKVARVISILLSKHLEVYLVPHSETRDAYPERT